MPLTEDRAKPAVPFGGQYRLIDFALSNLLNSGLRQIVVLTQYKSHSLDRHVSQTWRMNGLLNSYVASVPAQQRLGKRWFSGSADAILQSLNLIYDEQPDIIVVVGADHVYRMDFSQMIDAHVESGLAATVAAIRQPISLADQFGVIEVDAARPDSHPPLPREAEGPRGPPRLAARGAGVHGQLRVQRRRAHRRGAPRRGAHRLEPRHGRRHHPGLRRRRALLASTTSSATRCPAPPIATATTGATWERSTRSSRRTRTSSRCCPCSTSTTASGRSSASSSTRRPRSSRATPADRSAR